MLVQMPDSLNAWIASIVLYGGGSATVAFLLFRFLGTKWIENKFHKVLEEAKHMHAKELQRLRVEIDSLVSGRLKMQELEFVAIPEAWKLLSAVNNKLMMMLSPVRLEMDFHGMSLAKLNEFVATTPFPQTIRDEILQADVPGDRYREALYWFEINDTAQAVVQFMNLIEEKWIFFPASLSDDLNSVGFKAKGICNSKKVRPYNEQYQPMPHIDTLEKEFEQLYTKIKASFQDRLISHGAL